MGIIMIIVGYQVVNQFGNHWNNRPSFEILTEETAISELTESRLKQEETGEFYQLLSILDGDIEEPTFEADSAIKGESPNQTQRQIIEYKKTPSHCPDCHSGEIEGGSVDIDAGVATQKVVCNVCDAVWTDIYKLTSFQKH